LTLPVPGVQGHQHKIPPVLITLSKSPGTVFQVIHDLDQKNYIFNLNNIKDLVIKMNNCYIFYLTQLWVGVSVHFQFTNRGVAKSVARSLPNSGLVDCIWIVMVMVTVAFLSYWILRTK